MNTKIIENNNIEDAALIIKEGGTVVFPTETVYGLGADAFNSDAVKKIFIAKGRPSDNPLIIHIEKPSDIEKLTTDFTKNAKLLADAFMPGPITLVLKKNPQIPDSVCAGLKTVGIRCPENEIARKFIALAETPIAAPSANISGSVSATSYIDVKDELYGRVDAIIKGKDSKFGIESTVIDVSGDEAVILRPGSITYEMIKEIIPDVKLHSSLTKENASLTEVPASPGMKYTHYAPKAEVYLVYGESQKIKEWFLESDEEEKCLFIFSEYIDKADKRMYDIGSKEDYNKMAALIFKYMKKADREGYKKIYINAVKEKNIGFSVMNRLKKSSGGKKIVL